MARAHTESGEAQPFEYDPDNLGYLINIVLPRVVHVVATESGQSQFADERSWADSMEAFAEGNIRRPLDLELRFWAGEGI